MAYDGFYLTYKSDRETNERFDRVRERFPNIRMVKINLEDWSDPKLDQAITKIAEITNTKHFWIIDPDVEVDDDFDFEFRTSEYDNDVVHLWNATERNVFRAIVGVKLFKTSEVKSKEVAYIQDAYFMTGEFKEHETEQVEYKPTTETYEIFYWKKDYGKANLENLQKRFPEVVTVTGENNVDVHKKCREQARTDFYYLVHPNAEVYDTFKFDYSFAFGLDKDNQKVVVWQKTNPITGDVREYHGVGLFPKEGPLFTDKEYSIFNFRRKAVHEKSAISRDVKFPVIRTDDLHNLRHTVDSDMYWLVHNDVVDPVLEHYPFSYDREFIHNFKVTTSCGNAIRNGVRLVPNNPDTDKQKDVDQVLGTLAPTQHISASTLKGGLAKIEKYPSLIVDPAVTLSKEFDFYPDLYELASAHVFEKGVVFVNSEYDEYNLKFNDTVASIVPEYDIFFWHRGYGTQNFNELQSRFPRIQSVSTDTISELHEFARTNSKQNYYYVITSDTTVTDFDFNYQFDFSMTEEGRQQIVVWQKTDWNDVPMEYHGVGLFRKDYAEFSNRKYQQFDFRRKALYQETAAVKPERYDVCHVNDLLALDTIKNCDTEMVWMIHSDVSDARTDYIPPLYDRSYIHNFNVELPSGKTVRNGVRLVPINYDTEKQKDVDTIAGTLRSPERIEARTVKEAVALATQETFWMVNPDLQLTDTMIDDFYPDLYDTGPTHIWKFTSRKGVDLGHGGLALSNTNYHPENVIYHDEFVARVPDRHNIKKYYTRDPYKAYKQSKKHVFYWVVDTVVELVDDFDFDYYPDIHSIENVFAFKSEGEADAGVYLVHRPHLAEFNPSEEDFSFDRFKNIIRVDHVASRTVGHPVFYFDEGMYKENTAKFDEHSNIDVIDATDLAAAYKKAAKMSSTGYFWAIDNDVELLEDFDRTFYIDRHHKSHFHVWPKESPYTGFVHQYGGLKLIPTAAILELKPDADKLRKMTFKNKKPVRAKTPMTRDIPYDVIMLSYQEKLADEHYAKLLERVPHAKRVHGVKGIFNAHQAAANLADTRMFYVIDADALLLEEFNFEYSPSIWDEDTVHTWKSKNPVNDLIYGYGGLKLFPTQLLRDATDWRIDFTTSVSEKFKPMPTPANYTAFNTDPFNTWKSAFRECTKLASSIIHNSKQDEDDERLEAWCTKGADRDFGKYAIAGANAGRAWGTKHADNDEMLGMINDFAWLEEKFEEDNND